MRKIAIGAKVRRMQFDAKGHTMRHLHYLVMIIIVTSLLAACASSELIPSDDPPLSPVRAMSNDECARTDIDDNGWNECTRAAARETYEYAQMAANAYDIETFNLSPTFKLANYDLDTDLGTGYVIYERLDGDEITEVIIAYRGTDFTSWRDWFNGNLFGGQRAEAIRVYDDVLDEYEMIPSVTGHSLGGALASQVSLCRDVHLNIVFNSSPRFSRAFCKPNYLNRNYSVVEIGEINALLRVFAQEATQTYNSVGCIDQGGPIFQHSMAKLAACITAIAAATSEEARSSAVANGITRSSYD